MGERRSRRWMWWGLLILVMGCTASVALTVRSFIPVTGTPQSTASACVAITTGSFASPQDGFSAAFPCTPSRSTATASTPFGKIEVVTYEAAADGINYAVSFVDYSALMPGDELPPLLVNFILDGARRGVLRSAGMGAPTTTDIKVGEYIGQAISAENDEKILRGRITIVGESTYQIVIVTPKARAADTLVNAFLDSFQVMPRQTATTGR
jgi:hypothetical protein